MSQSTIITGQFVCINQTPASIGDRILAFCLDYFFLLIYLISISYTLIALRIPSYSTLFFFLVVLCYLPALCYSLLCEVFNNGQSLGKRLLNMRVVKADGSTPSLGSYLLRWLLFAIDLPLTGGLGVLVILLNKNNQRLGDLAAGTIVIKENHYKKIQVSLDEFDYLTKGYHPKFPLAAELSLEQVNVISKTLASANKERLRRITQLAQKVRPLLESIPEEITDEKFLETVLRDYQYYALEEI